MQSDLLKSNGNTASSIDEIIREKKQIKFNNISIFDVIFKPVLVLVKYYFLDLKVLKGTKGFVDSVMSSFERFMQVGESYIVTRKNLR